MGPEGSTPGWGPGEDSGFEGVTPTEVDAFLVLKLW